MTVVPAVSAWLKAITRRETRYPPAPPGLTLYAVGDIHGRSDCLARAHELIDGDAAARDDCERREIYVGDYVDRGPDSKGVIDLMIERARVASLVALKGNHELVMEGFLRGELVFEEWRELGGLETVLSYGVDARALLERGGVAASHLAAKMPASHLHFLAGLRSVHTIGDYCFAHAGVRPGVPVARQTARDLAWIRDDFLTFAGRHGFVVVHGHTPAASAEFHRNRINIDTGAYLTNRLTVLRIDADGPVILGGAAR